MPITQLKFVESLYGRFFNGRVGAKLANWAARVMRKLLLSFDAQAKLAVYWK
jgi:hypothetical protein